MVEIVIVEIKNGWLLAVGQDSVYCKDAAALHRELEFIIGTPLPEPPKPPTEKSKVDGVRQFDDED